jgi:hypothetical protein
MRKEEELLGNIVKKLIHNGALDHLVAAVIEDSLGDCLESLEKLCQRKYLEAHHWQDYADALSAADAMIRVLQYFAGNLYIEEENKVHYYSQRLEVI